MRGIEALTYPYKRYKSSAFKLEHLHIRQVYRVCFGSAFDDFAISAWQREHGGKRRVAGKDALGDTEKLVLDLYRRKRFVKRLKAVSRWVNEGPTSMIGGGHEPGTLPFRL